MASWEDINLEEIKTGFVTKGLKDPPSSGGRQSMVTILNTFLDAMEENSTQLILNTNQTNLIDLSTVL